MEIGADNKPLHIQIQYALIQTQYNFQIILLIIYNKIIRSWLLVDKNKNSF